MPEVPPDQTPTTRADPPATMPAPPDQTPTIPMVPAGPPARGAPPAAALSSGASFGHYRLLEKLGQGGMGVVWKAYDTELTRVVALKQILRDDGDPRMAERFHREAQSAAHLRHPHIVAVYEVGVVEGHLYFTTEYIEGRTLRDVVHAEPLSPRRAVEVVREVADAVSYAHSQGLVHRDIKPENILMDAAGKAYLMDFGLAKDLKDELGTNLTLSGQVLGTPGYMSPEQAEGWSEAIGPPTDQFALGVVLYELLTGMLPFAGKTFAELLDSLRSDEPTRPAKLNPHVHRDVETICLKALDREAVRRYASTVDFAADLGRWLEGEPISARPASVLGRLWRKASRNRRVVLAVTAILVAAVVWGAAGVAQARKRRQTEDEVSRLLEEGRQPLDQAQLYLYREGANYDEMRHRAEAGQALIGQALAEAPDSALGHDLQGRAWSLLGWEDKAEDSYREAIRSDSQFGSAHFHLGMVLLNRAIALKVVGSAHSSRAVRDQTAQSWISQARPEFDAAARCSRSGLDERAQALLQVAQSFAAGGKEEVLRLTTQALTRFGESPGCELFYLIRARVEQGEACSTDLDAALRLCPGEAYARNFRGAVRYNTRDTDGASADWNVALAVNPRFAVALNNRALARDRKGDHDGALADLGRALAIEPKDCFALANRASIRMEMGDLEGADSDTEQALAVDPTSEAAIGARGMLRCTKGDARGAITDYDCVIAMNAGSVFSYVNRAAARYQLGDLDGAIADDAKALEIDPDMVEAYEGRALAREAKGDFQGAIADCGHALAIDANRGHAYTERGRLRSEIGDFEGAIADYHAAGEREPDPALARCARGLVRQTKRDLQGAISEFDQAIALNPKCAQAYANRADCRMTKGDYDGAIADCTEAIAIHPYNADAWITRGISRCDKSDPDGAIADCTRALDIEPKSARAFINRGWARRMKGDLDGAIADYQQGLDLAPKNWPPRAEVERVFAVMKNERVRREKK